MINTNERRISSMSVDEIKKFIHINPNARIIHMRICDEHFVYVTYQNEKLRIERNHLRGYRCGSLAHLGGYDYNLNLSDLKFKDYAFLCTNEDEFEDMVESFMKENKIKLIQYISQEIDSLTKKNNEIVSKTKWYEGLH